ncbi:hypothetical protein FKW77_008879 [Venturia effusa]|uniref:Rhodopsin domain-containing protein n=1 Tax=Venturia effusa TaxID=50376 RepID=A0A517LCT0_9PEZI|nr:hypothetical protein FKW77_008879 [Venturia effusa]
MGFYCVLTTPQATPDEVILASKLLLPGRLCYALLSWEYDPEHKIVCQKAMVNLLVMAVLNMVTDIALFLLPLPVLWKLQLSMKQKLQLGLVFGVGIFVIAVTTARIPVILEHSVDQKTRSRWASIEIVTACLVANVAFFYALLKDLRDGHSDSRASISSTAARSIRTKSYSNPAKLVFSKEIRRTDELESTREGSKQSLED